MRIHHIRTNAMHIKIYELNSKWFMHLLGQYFFISRFIFLSDCRWIEFELRMRWKEKRTHSDKRFFLKNFMYSRWFVYGSIKSNEWMRGSTKKGVKASQNMQGIDGGREPTEQDRTKSRWDTWTNTQWTRPEQRIEWENRRRKKKNVTVTQLIHSILLFCF